MLVRVRASVYADPQAVHIRVWDKINAKLPPSVKPDICRIINEVERENVETIRRSIEGRDYVTAKRLMDELVDVIDRFREISCVRVPPVPPAVPGIA